MIKGDYMGLSKRGQSILEYSILLAVILSAILIMQFYVKRSYQGRLKTEADSVGQQYSPGHTTSTVTTTTNSISETKLEDGVQIVRVYGSANDGNLASSTMRKQEIVDSFSKEISKE